MQINAGVLCWAALAGDKERLKESIVWGEEAIAAAKASMGERFNLQEFFFTVSSPPGQLEGFRIFGAELVAPERMLARVEITTRQGNEAVTELKRVPLIFVNGEWKWFVKTPADVHAIPFRGAAGVGRATRRKQSFWNQIGSADHSTDLPVTKNFEVFNSFKVSGGSTKCPKSMPTISSNQQK